MRVHQEEMALRKLDDVRDRRLMLEAAKVGLHQML